MSVAGRMPEPTTTRSAGRRSPFASRTAAIAPFSSPSSPATVLRVEPGEDGADHGADLLLERRRVGHHDRHLKAPLAQAGRCLHADEPAADDDGAAGGLCPCQDGVGIARRPQEENAIEIGAGKVRRIGCAAGGQKGGVVGESGAVLEVEGGGRRIHRRDGRRHARDAVALVEGRVLQRCLLGARLAREPVFAEHRPVVGQLRLLAHQHEASGEAILPQRLCGGLARGAGADDDEAAVIPSGLYGGRGVRLQRNENPSVLDPNGKGGKGIDGRRLHQSARTQVKTGLVPRADDAFPAAHALCQARAGMRAGAPDGRDGSARSQEQQFRLAGLDAQHAALGNGRDRGHIPKAIVALARCLGCLLCHSVLPRPAARRPRVSSWAPLGDRSRCLAPATPASRR
jgi:hypothetical protein